MAGIKKLRRIQFFKETTAGTKGLATSIWRGLGVSEDLREPYFPEEDIGYLVDTNRAVTPFELAQIELEEVPATFEQLGYLLSCGIKKLNTGVADGGGSGKIYNFPVSVSPPVNDFQTLTIESGDNQQVEFMPYSFVETIKLSGKPKDTWKVSATLKGRRTEPNSYTASMAFVASTKKITDAANGLAGFTTGMMIQVIGSASNDGIYTVATGGVAGEIVVSEALTDEGAVSCTVDQFFTTVALPAVEEILFQKTKFYADPVSDAFGETIVPCTLWGFDIEIQTGIQAMFSASGELYFCKAVIVNPSVTMHLKFEHNKFASEQKALWRANTPQLLRLAGEGSTLTTAGAYSKKMAIIDLAGMWDKIDKIGENEGNSIMEGDFRCAYDPTAAEFANLLIVNQLASLP